MADLPALSQLSSGGLRYLAQTQHQLNGHAYDLFQDDNGLKAPNPARLYIYQHGCYCFPSASSVPGSRFNYHGPPIDELDDLCLQLSRAQRCLKIERNCNVNEFYPFYLEEDEVTGKNKTICDAVNNPNFSKREKNQCKIENCKLEAAFVEQVVDLISGGYVKNWDFTTSDANYTQLCVPNGHLPVAKNGQECCGTGLSRRSFDPRQRECCQESGIIINPNTDFC